MEQIDINFDTIDDFDTSFETKKTVNFGSGIELLMNDKVKNSSSATTIDMEDLDNLENELNNLSSNNFEREPSNNVKSFSGFSNFFGGGNSKENVKIIPDNDNISNVGYATVESMGNNKTWDGYSKIGEVPNIKIPPTTSINDREKRRKKRMMINSLEEWHSKGIVKNISHFTMDSNYEEIEDEYEGALEDKRKRDAVKMQQKWLITAINTIEYGNSYFNPFDFKLDGWGEAISEDIDNYDEIFEQLHEKWKGGKMSPELSLLLKLAFSGSVIHFSNSALSNAPPIFSDVLRHSPQLMREFTKATVSSMKENSPGMAFASELLNNNRPTSMTGFSGMGSFAGSGGMGSFAGSGMTGPPPVPVETRNQPPPPVRPGMQFTQNTVRPDITASRGNMFQEQGVEINNFQSFTEPSSSLPPRNENFMPPPPPQQRPEMNGPKMTDLDNILSGLKTKTIDIHQTPNPDDSIISITSLKSMQDATLPKKSRRKPKSDKNIISLDI